MVAVAKLCPESQEVKPTNPELFCALYTCLDLLAMFLPSILAQSHSLTQPSSEALAKRVLSNVAILLIAPLCSCK